MERSIVGKIDKKYSPSVYEHEILKWWDKEGIYERAKRLNEGRKKFYFLDGPPYVTNPPHVGTAWNKILKDVIIRFKKMEGFDVRDQPGYDCHGLPIEVKVEEELGVRAKKDIEEKISVRSFIELCKKFAEENARAQTEIFKDLGVWMDWDHPYMTLRNEYMESVWWAIKKAYEKKLLKKGLKVVHWCPRCETALSGYEVTDEYRVVEDRSIYVKFPVTEGRKFILIWTTTPWTLPANVAVMVHPDESYVEVEADGETYILAEARREAVSNELGKELKVIKRVKGKELEGLRYRAPLLEEVPLQSKLEGAHVIVTSAEYVNMDEGTGCVHCAPGHGEEDFEVGVEYGLPVVSPVDHSGRFTEEAGKYAGMYVKEADPLILEDLKRKSLLLRAATVKHPYPHCWRCKAPLILRATEQWFIKVTEYKDKLLKENQSVFWVPGWGGEKRFKDWLLGARDWVVSRQRFWGIPLPIWICEDCGNEEAIGSISELKSKALNFPREVELHRHCVDGIYLKCRCGGRMKRIPDILDVWMDSGAASWASLGYPMKEEEFRKWWPADVVVEAHDQTRGWFYTQLCAGILAFDRSPYRSVVMHGHTLDAAGQKMSKSLGNFISPQDAIAKYGRDALRLYELQRVVWEDFRFSWEKLEEAWRNLQIVWNVYSFASTYMNLDGFQPTEWPVEKLYGRMRFEDRWIISRTENLKAKVTEHLEKYQIHLAAKEILDYVIEDLSRWYVKLVRRRFWQEKESLDKMSAYSALYHALKSWLLLAAPLLPFISEKLYRDMVFPAEGGTKLSVHMNEWPKPKKELINERIESEMERVRKVVEAALSARQSLKIKLRQPISRVIVVTDSPEVKKALTNLKELILQQTNAKSLEFLSVEDEEILEKISAIPKYEVIGPTFKAKAAKVAEKIKVENGREVLRSLKDLGFYEASVDGEKFRITRDMVSFKEELPEGFAAGEFPEGRVYVDGKLTEDLLQEGLVKDVVRRLQEMRGEMDLPVDAFISAYVKCPTEREEKWIKARSKYIMEEVRAKKFSLEIPKGERFDHEKAWVINGKAFGMAIKLEKN